MLSFNSTFQSAAWKPHRGEEVFLVVFVKAPHDCDLNSLGVFTENPAIISYENKAFFPGKVSSIRGFVRSARPENTDILSADGDEDVIVAFRHQYADVTPDELVTLFAITGVPESTINVSLIDDSGQHSMFGDVEDDGYLEGYDG